MLFNELLEDKLDFFSYLIVKESLEFLYFGLDTISLLNRIILNLELDVH